MSLKPILRFCADDGTSYPDWESMTIGDYLSKKSIKQIPTSDAPLMAFVAHKGVTEKGEKYDRGHLVKSADKKYKRTDLNDFIYSSNNLDVGSIGLNKYGSAVISEVYEIFSINDEANPDFISEVIQKPDTIDKIIRFRQGCLYGQYKIYPEDFLDVEINMPSRKEQDKVASLITLLNEKISIQEEKVEAFERRRKGLLQQVFSQKIRFTDDDGSMFPDWETHAMGEFFTERKSKAKGQEELLSVTIANGVIRQSDSDKRDNSSDDKSNYKQVMKGDIAYNTMRMWQGAEGVSYWDGIVSPAYTVIIPREGVNSEFFMRLFKTWDALIQFTVYSQGLSSDNWNLKFDLFSEIEFDIPCPREQEKIVALFNLLDKQIQIEKEKSEAFKQIKKGLFQQIFI